MEKFSEFKLKVDRLMSVSGKIRGEALLNRIEYIRMKKGEAGVKAVEDELKELEYPLKFKSISSLNWYSDANSILIIIVARKIFKWNDEEIFRMGYNAPKISFIVKMLLKFFVSPEKTFKSAPVYWEKHHNVGEIEDVKYDEEKKKMTLKLTNYKLHPIMCAYLKGYFLAFAKMALNNDWVKIKETDCMFKNSACHKFEINWK